MGKKAKGKHRLGAYTVPLSFLTVLFSGCKTTRWNAPQPSTAATTAFFPRPPPPQNGISPSLSFSPHLISPFPSPPCVAAFSSLPLTRLF